MPAREASFYQKLPNNSVRCDLCEHRCVIDRDQSGFCKVRQNQNGSLKTLVYGLSVLHKETPIEQHRLYHFQPGSNTYAVGTPGCNFRCWWCSEWKTAHLSPSRILASIEKIEPAGIIGRAKINGSKSITFTFTEPTVFFEYAHDIARLAKKAGLSSALVTNGYMTPEMLEAFLPYLDAASVDLKTFRKNTFFGSKKVELNHILGNLKRMKAAGLWVEVNTLLIPGVNEDPDEMCELASFIAGELGPGTPLHLSLLSPVWDPTRQSPEEMDRLRRVKQAARGAGLHHVYLKHLPGESNTLCASCGKTLIERRLFQTNLLYDEEGRCPDCAAPLAGRLGAPYRQAAIIPARLQPLAKTRPANQTG